VFLQKMPNVEVEIINKFQFSGHEGLLNYHIDILITPDRERKADIHPAILVVCKHHAQALSFVA
jgi:LysR family transcriptional regulator for metE and metH